MILFVDDVFRRLVLEQTSRREEIIAEHQGGLCRYVLECLRLQGSPLGVQSVVIFQGQHTPTGTVLLRQAEDSFPHLAAVGGVSRLSCNRPISNRFSQRSALRFFRMNDFSPLLYLLFSGLPS
jgi:hypothetical protein